MCAAKIAQKSTYTERDGGGQRICTRLATSFRKPNEAQILEGKKVNTLLYRREWLVRRVVVVVLV